MVQERKSNEVECTELEKEMMKLKSKGLEKKVEEENENISHLHQWIHSNIGNLDYGVDGKGLGLRRTLKKSTKKWSRGFLELYNAETDPEVKAVMRDMAKDLDRWIISATNSCCGYKKRGWWNYIKLIGFTDQDVASLTSFFQKKKIHLKRNNYLLVVVSGERLI